MAKFNLDKRGYNPSEVDDYINKMYLFCDYHVSFLYDFF